ncbi:MAG: cobaltochelatase subunit CobN [Geobacteraceae bacterium]|nr:cobaltochelatase subunit CobN [Geobacteraceae bacterium]
MKLFTIMWSNYVPPLKAVCAVEGLNLTSYSNKQINLRPELLDNVRNAMKSADFLLLYRTSDPFWEELESDIREAGKDRPVVVTGSDPSLWGLSTVSPEVSATVYTYLLFNGEENLENLVRYLHATLFDKNTAYREPAPVAWEGIHHPLLDGVFTDTSAYLDAYRAALGEPEAGWVGLLYSRSDWVNGNMEVERSLIAGLEEQGLGVIPAFFYSIKDVNLGNRSGAEVIEEYFTADGKPMVAGIVKLSSFFLASGGRTAGAQDAPAGVEVMKRLNIPLFCPLISHYKDADQWLADPEGLGRQVGWSIAMPEFEGVIEPMVIGASQGAADPENERYEPIPDRIARFAQRVAAWLQLGRKPVAERKVAFILHNNPCVSVEASVGGGAHLDTMESVARIMHTLREAGYAIDPPADGKALIDDIMNRKAVSEFRWTTVEEIVTKEGALDLLETKRYLPWFEELPQSTRNRMIEAWGNPPGEEKNGVPAAMVHDGRIVISGLRFGNAVVCAQPKRGCAGARCDGEVCKILHDPDVPPPHQYVATYKWLSREFGADVLIHVGTHGNLEFLPGKATGLSSGCFPDIGIDTMPHLYIYNADNPPEGTIAKRRSNAVLVNHLQTVMAAGELYGDLDALERLLEEYRRYRGTEPGKAHTISHLIADTVKTLSLLDEEVTHRNMDEKVIEIHDALTLLKGTRIPKGMHVFGVLPEGKRLAEFVYAVVRYENSPESLRGLVARTLEPAADEDNGSFRDRVDDTARILCRDYLELGRTLSEGFRMACSVEPDREIVKRIQGFIDEVRDRVLASDEIGALLNGCDAGYVEPGPSGLITRGRPDILPTGRNFYSLDPQKIPSPAAWETGQSLAEKILEKYLADEGTWPENIAFHWQSTDIMWSEGEGLAQMLFLLGVRPCWQPNGRVRSFTVIPLEELERPRIDITVRVSGITRDNFPTAIELLDEAVQAVAGLSEPLEMNYIRKHTLERLEGTDSTNADKVREATYRIFASMPGTYQAGTQLAVYASAWKTEQDLADVFLYWNGYAYGKGVFGEQSHGSLKESLRTVTLTFNKTVTDEYDLTGCCCHFGTLGGMINAAKVLSGKEIRNYYGDTREQGEVAVRTLEEEIRRVARGKILNPIWIDGMKEHGYKGAGEISKRVGRLYGWQATAQAVDGAVFDDITRTFLMDEKNREFFEKNNPWALEEMGRRLLEAAERGLWKPADDVREELMDRYLEIEGWIEERMGDVQGDFQGGSIDIMTAEDVPAWRKKMGNLSLK